MLGKLIKYDLKANQNVFLLMYGMLLVIALGTRMVLGGMTRDLEGYVGLGLIAVLLLLSLLMVVVVISTLGYILIIRRFYRHLFGGEGYLSFTLPVTAFQHFAAKLISGIIWLVTNLAVQAAAFLILAVGAVKNDMVKQVLEIMRELYEPFFVDGALTWQIVFAVLNTVVSLMMVYFCICLGQMSRRRRVMSAIIWYIGLSIVLNMIGSVSTEMFVSVDIMGDLLVTYKTGYYVMNAILIVLKMVIFAGGSVLIMQKKLNLE